MIEVLLHSTFAEAQIAGDLLVGLGFANESHNLLFAEREGVTWFVDGLALGSAARRTSVLFSARVKGVPATRTTPRHRCASGGQRNIRLLHKLLVWKRDGFLRISGQTAYRGRPPRPIMSVPDRPRL